MRIPIAPAVRRLSERGVMLAEVLVATVLLVVAAGAAVQLTLQSLERMRTAATESAAAIAADQKLQQLRALSWTVDAAGVPASDASTRLSVEPPDDGGSGLEPSPPDSLERDVEGFADALDGDLQVVGPGAGRAYRRRWRIASLPADPDHTRVLEVLVMPVATASRPRSPGVQFPGEARLTSALTRLVR